MFKDVLIDSVGFTAAIVLHLVFKLAVDRRKKLEYAE